ncbi:L,D-transpeptidase family protein [Chryseosolibacter indicus]|uniref:L,D-transpeptidase family protein n=1 Tax=Chryseosolibacter indicus TaxID=2782351 RepID=A0ABS5VPM5_9BACT|nr:L,D-transpeptidase family protein [Chryseosolibacter indicus]MBT1702739.1 L,D-transpeptidase family protein [Chryseosolibacter indicus]
MYIACLIGLMMLIPPSFKEIQLKNSRVKVAYDEKEEVVKKHFKDRNLKYKGFNLFVRAFKKEKKLEIWIKEKGRETYSLLHTYNFCSSSGTLGPKRKEGDLQIPEGIYYINHFNPQSNFYLSLGINYPNASDKVLSDPKHPGGLIYIHGNCVTVGCIPITDDKIKELYVLAVEARNNGQTEIPVHIFPSKLNDKQLTELEEKYGTEHKDFWLSLRPIYNAFETSKKLPEITVTGKGRYQLH